MSKGNSFDIFFLIQGLKPTEKAYFRKYALVHSAENNSDYLRLFDAIAGQDRYDEKKIREEEEFRYFSDLKRYLGKMVLKALGAYRTGSVVSSRRQLQSAEILFEKGLFAHCRATVTSAKRLAKEHEDFTAWIEALGWEKRLLLRNMQHPDFLKLSGRIQEEKRLVINRMLNVDAYARLAERMRLLRITRGITKIRGSGKELKAIGRDPLLRNESAARSREAKRYYYFIRAMLHEQSGEEAQSYLCRKKIVAGIESSPFEMKERPLVYLFNLFNLGIAASRFSKDEAVRQVISKIKSFPASLGSRCTEEIEIKAFERSRNLELYLQLTRFEYGKIPELIGEISLAMERWNGKMEKELEIIFCYHFSLYYFTMHRYDEALRWINRIIHGADSNTRWDIVCGARVFSLIIHYELNNTDLLEYLVRSTYRYLYKKRKLYRLEAAILHFIRRRMARISSDREMPAAAGDLLKELQKIIKDPFERQSLEFFDFVSWLESKISGRPFAVVVREKAGKE